MASGFIVLSDGRCFARGWSAYDEVLRAVAAELHGEFQEWLVSLVPNTEDEEHLGYGPGYANRISKSLNDFLMCGILPMQISTDFRRR
jgi:hypothetical protein